MIDQDSRFILGITVLMMLVTGAALAMGKSPDTSANTTTVNTAPGSSMPSGSANVPVGSPAPSATGAAGTYGSGTTNNVPSSANTYGGGAPSNAGNPQMHTGTGASVTGH